MRAWGPSAVTWWPWSSSLSKRSPDRGSRRSARPCSGPGARWGVVLLLSVLLTATLSGGCATRQDRPTAEPVAVPHSAEVQTSLYLLGDAGDPDREFEPVFAALENRLAAAGGERVVLFLGDNIYPAGMPAPEHPGRNEAERRLKAQIDLVREAGVRGILLPGNHDWGRRGSTDPAAIIAQDRFIRQHGAEYADLIPAGGEPGPVVVDIGEQVRVIAIDTQWWLQQPEPFPDPGSRSGTGATEHALPADSGSHDPREALLTALAEALRTAGNRHVVLAGHHPLASGGRHGGRFRWTDHLFPLRALSPVLWLPLPVLGSAYPISRMLGISPQDVSSPRYRAMIASLRSVFGQYPPLVYAAGHEHNLQVIRGESVGYILISGAGCFDHLAPTGWLETTLFAARRSGFMELQVLTDGRVRLGVRAVDARGRSEEVYARWLN